MNIIESIKKELFIDYGNLDEESRAYVCDTFANECITKINWISAVAFWGEIVIMLFDIFGGFFKNSINHLNLLSEVLIISSSFIANAMCGKVIKNKSATRWDKKKIIFFYKTALYIAVGLFIFTDIYVRHTPIGSYVVFLFVFQTVPFYRTAANLGVFFSYAIMSGVLFTLCVPGVNAALLFGTVFVFISFAISSECIRLFFIKKIVNDRKNQLLTKRFSNLASQSIMALSNAVEVKDLYTKGHSQRVARYSQMLAERMGFDRSKQSEIYYIGLLHDIGKIGVRDSVINKEGKLTDEEFDEIKKHPEMGYDILKNITEIPDISLGAKFHHEKYDGTGYPDRLSGENIPLIARIIAVADAYDAMTSKRSYRDTLPQNVVRDEIAKNLGKQFDPEIGKVMLDMIDADEAYLMREGGSKA